MLRGEFTSNYSSSYSMYICKCTLAVWTVVISHDHAKVTMPQTAVSVALAVSASQQSG